MGLTDNPKSIRNEMMNKTDCTMMSILDDDQQKRLKRVLKMQSIHTNFFKFARERRRVSEIECVCSLFGSQCANFFHSSEQEKEIAK